MLEIEFIDRSVALASKAFVSFFPLVIVVSAFLPARVRNSIFTTVTHRLGFDGGSLDMASQAFHSSSDIRRATGTLGLIFTIFFATSFTTALQRVYLRAWRRPPGTVTGAYARGTLWFLAVLVYLAVLGGLRSLLGGGPQFALFVVVSFAATIALWWCTAWSMLMGQVHWRAVALSGLVTGVALSGFVLSAAVWMPGVVSRNEAQFGFFGVALALVSWFSGAAMCVLVGACVGAVFAADPGRIGTFIRGSESSFLVDGATPSLPGPERRLAVRDGFAPIEDDAEPM